jgi:TonB-dependent receptor
MKQLLKTFTLLLVLLSSALADETGSASIFSFYNGVALEKNEVLLDGKYSYFTDEDGSVELILEKGKHQIEVFAKDENGQNLGYVKRTIEIKESRDTQVIVTFEENNLTPHVEIDTPIGVATATIADTLNTGIFHGTVLTSDKNLPISNARVFVKGTNIDAKTDDKGNFFVEIPADTDLSLSIVHSEYSSQTLNNIMVKKDETINQEIKLTPASMELEEFIVLAPKVEGSIASIMAEEKKSSAITNIVGASEISKKGDSSAAGALKRVTGVTIVDGKDVYVRGLGGRYSNVEMNSMPLPSPDPQSRTVPLDIFPSAVIGSMKVQKSATADIPASYGGGYVDIRTKDSSKENYFKIKTEVKSNSYTGKEVNNYEGSKTDYLGTDDGYRAIPSQILNDSSIIIGQPVPSFDPANDQAYATAITNRLFTTTKEALPYGGKVTLEGAYNFEIADKHHLSLFANYAYGQTHTYREEEYFSYDYEQATDSLYKDPRQWGDLYQTVDNYTNAGIVTAHYNYADVFNLKYTKLYSKTSESVTKISDGISGSSDDWRIVYDLNWEERTLDVDQLNGDLKYAVVDIDNLFSFGGEYALADLDQPNNVRYTYIRDTTFDLQPFGDPYLDRFQPTNFLNLTSKDNMNAWYLKNKTMLNIFNDEEYIEIGLNANEKTRESRYNKFLMNQSSSSGKLTDDIDTIYDKYIRQNYDGTFNLSISFQPAYWYDAEVEESAEYVNLFLKPTNSIEILVGARSVHFNQTVYQYTNNNNIFNPIEKVPETLEFENILPSFSLKYVLDKSNQINFAYAQTYIVPDLREFASTEYFHPYEIATVRGNPDLVNTDISNYDLKYSHYFSDTENINIGIFYKSLENPIEDTVDTRNALPLYSYANMENATLYGVELDGRRSFDLIHNSLHDFYMSGNFSYTKSDVTLTQEQETEFTSNHRELQGLSPIVVNLALSYEKKGRNITLAYNKMGERIRKVGMIDATDSYPDYYEVPPQILDFIWIERFDNGLSATLKLKNLLDEETIWYQGSKDNITNKFKVGQFYSVSVAYKF